MKLKTIKNILEAKMDKWVESVEDNDVKKAIKRSAIVTGGSIASMLLKEDVNDFDIYFKNKEDLRIICEYYTNNTEIEILCGEDKEYKGKLREELDGGIGASYSLMEEDQIKLWIGTEGYKEIKHEDIKENSFVPLYFTQNAITLSDKLQIVIRFNGKIDKIHENYDFVHATNSYDYKENELKLRQEALESLLTKELRYIGSKYPLTSIIRTKKFIKRNWNITAGEYLKIMWQVAELDLTDVNVLSEQLAGVDVAYFNQMIVALQKQGKEKMAYPYIFKIIDKIFN
jgi:hypothetical protein